MGLGVLTPGGFTSKRDLRLLRPVRCNVLVGAGGSEVTSGGFEFGNALYGL